MSLNIAPNGSMLGSNDLLKCLHFVNIWRRFLWLNKDQPMWTDSLCWKSEQNNVLKMLACPSLPVSSTRELKHWIETIAQTHFTQDRNLMQILRVKKKEKFKNSNVGGWFKLEMYQLFLRTVIKFHIRDYIYIVVWLLFNQSVTFIDYFSAAGWEANHCDLILTSVPSGWTWLWYSLTCLSLVFRDSIQWRWT